MTDERWPVREVVLVWEIDRLTGAQCLRAIDDDEELALRHVRAFVEEAKFMNRPEARFFTERSQTNHAFGFSSMQTLAIVMRGQSKP